MGTRTTGQKRVSRKIHTFKDNCIEYGHEGEAYYFERPLEGGVELYYLRINSPNRDEIFAVRPNSNFDNRANRSFFARVYKPSVATADHVVLIYNGLDETISRNPAILSSSTTISACSSPRPTSSPFCCPLPTT